jgi:HEAT repeat protein
MSATGGRRTASGAAAFGFILVLAGGLAGCGDAASTVEPGANGNLPGPSGAGSGGQATGPGGTEALVEVLRSGTRSERAAAAAELGALGDDDAVPALVAALDDESWQVRAAVAGALRDLPDPASVAPLLDLIAVEPAPPAVPEDELWTARNACNAAIEALGIIGDPAAATRLAEIATDRASELDREAAGDAVVAIGAAAVPAVLAVLDDASTTTAPAVVALLGRLGDDALDPLVAALKDKRAVVRVAAAKALGGQGAAAVKPLIAALGAKGNDLRIAAATALGALGDTRATEALVRLLATKETRPAAVRALVSIHRGDATPLVKYLKSASTIQVYRPLIRIGQADTVPALVKALQRFGNKTMGETYLNCGQPKLEKAAVAWGKAHGYIVIPSYGAGEEAWGGS